MPLQRPLQDSEMPPAARAVIEDIKATRKVSDVNNIWRVLANNPPQLESFWRETKNVMAPGALDALTKEFIYLAVSAANNCQYCLHTHSHAARAKGMTDAQFAELMQVIALASVGNRLTIAYQVDVDEKFRQPI
jgi:AhpD family alkylhydroperoxidase